MSEPNCTRYSVITFEQDDVEDPKNWTLGRKKGVVLILCVLSFSFVFGSSIYAPAQTQISTAYGVNSYAASSGLTLYVFGFGFGPLIWGPMSEMLGRKMAYSIAWPLLIACLIPSAFAENLTVILLFRFISGAAGSCALNNGSGVIADMFSNEPQRLAETISWYAFCPLSGPICGSIVGFFVAAHSSGTQLWVLRVHLFFVIACWPLVYFLPETYGPVILARRARKLREQGKIDVRAPHELQDRSARQLAASHVLRPFRMLCTEPIIQGAAVWITLAYSLIYFSFETYPKIFYTQHSIPFQLCGLMFIPVTLGMLAATIPFQSSVSFFARLRIPAIDGPRDLEMFESRLKIALLACVIMPVSLFWFALTSGEETHWIAPAISGFPIGYATLVTFYSFNSYSSQTFGLYASSASACITFVRSVVASTFPMLAPPLLNAIGTKLGISVFAFIALGLLPIPIIFIRHGKSLRSKSPHANEAMQIARKMRGVVEEHAPMTSQEQLLESAKEKTSDVC